MRSFARIVAVAAMGIVSLWGGTSAPAGAAPRAAAPAAFAPCTSGTTTVTIGGRSILALCGGDYEDGVTWLQYQNRMHAFVIRASDRSVSHVWETCAGCGTYSDWTGLYGDALSRVYYHFYDSGRALRIEVLGTYNGSWCRRYNDPSARGQWSWWYDC